MQLAPRNSEQGTATLKTVATIQNVTPDKGMNHAHQHCCRHADEMAQALNGPQLS